MEEKEDSISEKGIDGQFKNIEEKTLESNGYLAKINGEIFNPDEVSILVGDPMTREITQIIYYLCQAYPIEAISYCLQRCFYNTFSKTSLLDKTIKYLLTKYKEGENIITDLLFAYKDNQLNAKITNVNHFNEINNEDNRQLTKLVFYDPSKDGVDAKKFNFNEIFIEIEEKYILNNDNYSEKINGNNCDIISLDENEDQANFLCDKHHLFKRFSKRGNSIYIYNFIGFEKVKIIRRRKKYNRNNNEDIYDNSYAVFICEQKGCNSKYRYNFNSNKLTPVIEHNNDCEHIIDENAPYYYKQNIDILNEKPYITDIQLVRIGKVSL